MAISVVAAGSGSFSSVVEISVTVDAPLQENDVLVVVAGANNTIGGAATSTHTWRPAVTSCSR